MRAALTSLFVTWRLIAAALMLCLSTGSLSSAADLSRGLFLVASRQVTDPTFAETVVLLIRQDSRGAMGLIVNRRSEARLSVLLPGMPKTPGSADPVYVGGPVGRTGVIGLARSGAAPAGAPRVFADVHLISERALLEKTLSAGARSDVFRLYLGYAGWTNERLRNEIEQSLWHTVAADSAQVFDPRPDTLWRRLMLRIEGQLATNRPAATKRSGA